MRFKSMGPTVLKKRVLLGTAICIVILFWNISRTWLQTSNLYLANYLPSLSNQAEFHNNLTLYLEELSNKTTTKQLVCGSIATYSEISNETMSRFEKYYLKQKQLGYHTMKPSTREAARLQKLYQLLSPFKSKVPPAPAEVSKNIAFSIQVSSNNIEMVPRLMRAIYHPKNVYAVHFDAKIPTIKVQECLIELARQHFFRLTGDGLGAKDATDEMLLNQTKYFPDNIHFVPREPVTYAGITVVLNTIRLMTYLLQQDETWEYYINLSGSDYPLVSPYFLRRLLGRIPETEVFNFLWSDPNPGQYTYRFKPVIVDSSLYSFTPPQNETPSTADLHWLQCAVCDEGGVKRKKDIEHPFGSNKFFRTYKSEAWMVASRAFCRYAVTSWEAKQLLARLTNSWMTDEHYFITLLESSDMFKGTRVDDSLRSVTWYHPKKPRGPTTHPHSVDDVDLFWSNIRCSRAIFARKFTVPNGAMLELIDKELIGEEDREYGKEVIRKFDYLLSRTLAMRDEYINTTNIGVLK
ncbi:hypothetical protein GAYE_SCF03G2242 [Galdieria yellowstonensis]|uniref:Protein xylosyltransferase n=1 Tax=Galdieria yellowstonensis TaxID=3028027 RepID=A0AAV9IAI9_9RHOD|nr:hypothetical protein GAYE_SCF03G2242 [Galdieria yellowstonensis]